MLGTIPARVRLIFAIVGFAAVALALVVARVEVRAAKQQARAAEDRAAVAERARGILEGDVAALRASLADQNAAVDRLQAKAAVAYADGNLDRQRASEQGKNAAATAARLAKAQPKPGTDPCAAADALILGEVR